MRNLHVGMRFLQSSNLADTLSCASCEFNMIFRAAMQLHDYVGIFGVFLYLLAYALVQLGRLSLEDMRYGLINIVACACGMFTLAHAFNLSSFLSQSMWLLLTLVGIYRGHQRRRGLATVRSIG